MNESELFNILLSVALESTGFEICKFGPDENDSCERCNKSNQQLYYLRTNYWSEEGDYFCADCVIQLHTDNLEYAAKFEEERTDNITRMT